MSKTIAEILGLPTRVVHPVRHPEPIEGVTFDYTDPFSGEVYENIEMLAHNYSYQIQFGFDPSNPKWGDKIIAFEHVGDGKVKPTWHFRTPEEVREWIRTPRRP